MNEFIFEKAKLDGVKIITPKQFCNEIGEFEKKYEREIYISNHICFDITEEYKLLSDKGVLRGIHFQEPNPQARLISVLSGEALVAVVDLRRDSAKIGEWETYKVNTVNRSVIYVPRGFGVGTFTLADKTIIEVKCSGQYYGENSQGICYDDADLDIDWGITEKEKIVISQKDRLLMSFREYVESK